MKLKEIQVNKSFISGTVKTFLKITSLQEHFKFYKIFYKIWKFKKNSNSYFVYETDLLFFFYLNTFSIFESINLFTLSISNMKENSIYYFEFILYFCH